MGGDDGHHQRQFQYQSLLAAVHTMPGQGQQNPNQTLPFPLPFPAGPGADASTHSAAPQSPTPRGFADWSASSSAFTSLAAQATPATSNAFHYSLSPCSAFWTHYLLNNNAYCSYPPAPHQEHAHPWCHNDNRAKDPGPASSFGVESFTTTSLAPNICAYMPPIEGPISAKETEISEDLPRAVKSSDVRATRNNGEIKCETVDTFPESKQGHESCATKLNSGEYQVILRKELTKSDVGNVGRIVLPKKDAEASFPPLLQRDPLILQMDDMVLPVTWKFKYRYWPNNKSRMYILDATGEFVKTHGLQAGDALVIYKNSAPGKFIIRGEKAMQLTTNP